jgi:hypothetical protein
MPRFSYVMINMYEKYDDMLIENPLLFIRGDACVKSSRRYVDRNPLAFCTR